MGWTNDLTEGVAELLAAAAVGVWNPAGIYNPGDVGITVGVIPADPERIVCLTPYPVEDTPGMLDVTVGLQVRCRGDRDPRTVQDLADAVYNALHGLTNIRPGGLLVAEISRVSASPLGPDQLGRHERSENYYALASRATAHNTD